MIWLCRTNLSQTCGSVRRDRRPFRAELTQLNPTQLWRSHTQRAAGP